MAVSINVGGSFCSFCIVVPITVPLFGVYIGPVSESPIYHIYETTIVLQRGIASTQIFNTVADAVLRVLVYEVMQDFYHQQYGNHEKVLHTVALHGKVNPAKGDRRAWTKRGSCNTGLCRSPFAHKAKAVWKAPKSANTEHKMITNIMLRCILGICTTISGPSNTEPVWEVPTKSRKGTRNCLGGYRILAGLEKMM